MTHDYTAGDLCTREVVFADRAMAAAEAARLMHTRHVGSLVVVDEKSPRLRIVVGMLTDRDISNAIVGDDRDPHATRVGDLMAADVVTAREPDSVADVLAVMRRRKVRRVPVTGPQGELVGILALDDIVAALAGQVRALADAFAAAGTRER